MTLSEKLQEVADARSKGLLSDEEAATQRAAILAEQQKQSAPLIALDKATLKKITKRPRCCTPLRCSKFIHWIIGIASVAILAVSVALSCVYYTDVWVTCNGPEANLLNQSHPYFCTDDWNDHEDDDDYYNDNHHHDSDRPKWGCGNERFQFTWDKIKYSNYNTTTEISWLDLLDLNDNQAFPLSIGSFTGSDSLWTQSHHAIKSLKVLGHVVSPFGLMTFIFMIVVVRRTFFRKVRVETPRRWMGFLALFTVILGLVIACTAVNSHMKITNTHGDHDDDDHHHHRHHHQRFAPAWASHYPAEFGCQATPFPVSLALSIVGIWIAGTMMAVSFIRMACLRCRKFEIDEEQHRFLTLRGYGQLNSVGVANPTINYGATPVPPAYVQNAKEQEMTASFA